MLRYSGRRCGGTGTQLGVPAAPASATGVVPPPSVAEPFYPDKLAEPGMRTLLLICISLVAAYCVDRNYYGGAFSRSGVLMLRQIVVAYK